MSDELSIPSPTYRIPRHRRGMDPATRRLALIAGGLGATLLAVVGGWTLIGHRSASVPVVQADNRPIRVKPENPGGMQVAGANEDILSGGTASKDGKLAPPPETPDPQALRAPPPAVPAAPPVVAAPAPVATVVPAPVKPVAAKPAAAPDKHPAAPAASGAQIQLAAVSSEEAARSEWQRLSKRLPDLLGQRRPSFSKTEHDGRTLWRVRAGGFTDVPQASTFCEKVRAKGVGCSVADFSKAAIVGIAEPALSADEAALFRAEPPCGVILFARNIVSPPQLAVLTADLRRVLQPGAVLMVDQEGGRVARLRPPHWRAHPPARALHGLRAAWLTGALIGLDCAATGFDVVAAPVLDLAIPGAHSVIGDRALGEEPLAVARLGRAMAAGLLAAGVQPVAKHAPGHGRARVDSHLALPRVEANALDSDLLPFVLNAELPWAMSAHIVYPAWDPALPATLSPTVIETIIRGRIGFEGVLVTDDLAMKALTGVPADLARQALAVGCDVALYCAGDFAPTADLLARCPSLTQSAIYRLAAARALAAARRLPLDTAALAAERDRLLA